ncbi:hypothetical protein EVAR_64518_1 [Eumeta japonica]|uniref:Uncharacterized protein n=1 Tax=Eumeta variegata TaxID=151549 RepID=A0A4C2A4S8_EUMVA|nr:hypothetical protein EVAR_64518_1 [Eumeta japonica]
MGRSSRRCPLIVEFWDTLYVSEFKCWRVIFLSIRNPIEHAYMKPSKRICDFIYIICKEGYVSKMDYLPDDTGQPQTCCYVNDVLLIWSTTMSCSEDERKKSYRKYVPAKRYIGQI